MLKNVKIVLCRASDAGNVGAVCRVMKNMGLSQLRLAAPQLTATETLSIEQQISIRAVHALDIWEKARFFDTLADSVKDCSIVVGTTRRRGQYRKNLSMTPRDLANWLAKHPGLTPGGSCTEEGGVITGGCVAIVFGNERTGLEADELDLCNFASHIPASEEQPSLNLSHAVQVYAYELYQVAGSREQSHLRSGAGISVKGSWVPMSQERISILVTEITDNLANIGFYKQHGREEQERFLRDMIARAGLSEKEGGYFRDLLIKAGRLGG